VLETRFVNTSALVFLVRENLLEILREGALEVVDPEPVINEIHGHGSENPTVRALHGVDWLKIVPASKIAPAVAIWDLGLGESFVLSLALAKADSLAVIDDWQARRGARSLATPEPRLFEQTHSRIIDTNITEKPASKCLSFPSFPTTRMSDRGQPEISGLFDD
jgi:hypothetical protein